MRNLINLVIAGLATGAIYALVAVGFTLLWQTSQTINFAQGEFVMLPAFMMLAAMNVGAAVLDGLAAAARAEPADSGHAIQAPARGSDDPPRRAAAGRRDHGARRCS